MSKLYCMNCDSVYEVKIDREGNAGKLPLYCPYCRQKIIKFVDKVSSMTDI